MNFSTIASTHLEEDNVTSLEKWNNEIFEKYLPNTVLISVGLMTGIPGNVVVILIYSCFVNKQLRGPGRFFILPLAYVDLVGLLFTGLLNILRNTSQVMFPGNLTCKLLVYGSYVVGCSSLFLLNCIAVQRYQKICQPFSRQMTKRYLMFSLVVCFAVGVLLNIPSLFYYGTAVVDHSSNANVTGIVCQKLVPGTTTGLRVYQGIGAVISTFNVACITYSYIRIAKTIFWKKTKTKSNKTCVPEQQSSTFTSNTMESDGDLQPPSGSSHANKQRETIRRLSVMFMVISITAILSYIPSWAMIAIETYNTDIWDKMTSPVFHICLTFRRMYILNHLCNPFIYGIFDIQFRQHVRKVFCVFKK